MTKSQRMETAQDQWRKLPWPRLRRKLFKLQCRLYKAAQKRDKAKVLFLQRLIYRSRGARFLAIRQVTQLNAGKKTAGVDGRASLGIPERMQLENKLRSSAASWSPSKLRSIPIPKKDGSTRMLKVPTIADRAWQCLVKYAIEPAHEARFHPRSYGFRPGRCTHDVQQLLSVKLNSYHKGITKRILEVDIEKCFDRIDHKALITRVDAPMEIKQGLWKTLKKGANPEFPNEGTPQGGVISPLLANIALDGIEDCGGYVRKMDGHGKHARMRTFLTPGIRYADDMVFVIEPQQCPKAIETKVRNHLSNLGLNVNEAKTRLVNSTNGFDFLGWNFRVKPNGKKKVVPSVQNFLDFRKKVKAIVNSSSYGAKVKSVKLAPIVRGWRAYHRFCDMTGSRFSLWFINHRAWKVFNREPRQNKHSVTALIKQAFPAIGQKQGGFVMVKGGRSIFDGDLAYWSKCNSKHYHGPTSRTLAKQNHTCGLCGQHMLDGERVHLHHKDGNPSNRSLKNLLAVHESCHTYHHMSNQR